MRLERHEPHSQSGYLHSPRVGKDYISLNNIHTNVPSEQSDKNIYLTVNAGRQPSKAPPLPENLEQENILRKFEKVFSFSPSFFNKTFYFNQLTGHQPPWMDEL